MNAVRSRRERPEARTRAATRTEAGCNHPGCGSESVRSPTSYDDRTLSKAKAQDKSRYLRTMLEY